MMIGHKAHIKDLTALAKGGTLGHSYVFFGASQIGKRKVAEALAEYLETGAWPEENSKRPLTDGRVFSPDEKGVIGIDVAREVRVFLSEKPFIGARRVAIIDRAEALTTEAQNALLKTAEEPPDSALLILVMPDPELLWPTLRSRFQKIYFPPVPLAEIEKWLSAVHGADAKKAKELAEKSLGKPGLALDLLESKGNEARELAERFFKTPPDGRKDFIKELVEPEDFSFATFLDSLITHLAASRTADKSGTGPGNGQLWHAVLELRRMQDATNLSPRIQLMNLWTLI
jgi:DNA polymerase-3 subunit delta'